MAAQLRVLVNRPSELDPPEKNEPVTLSPTGSPAYSVPAAQPIPPNVGSSDEPPPFCIPSAMVRLAKACSGIPAQSRVDDGHASTTATTNVVDDQPLWKTLRQGDARFVFDPDPYVCLRRICVYAINMTAGSGQVAAVQMYRRFRFDDLYTLSIEDWDECFREEFNRLAKTSRGKGVPLFVVERLVREVIPKGQRVYAHRSGEKRQDIKPIEFAYVLKSIVTFLRKRGGKRAGMMARNYFLTDEHRRSFKMATGRQLNTGKLARITDLLHRYGFVDKIRKTKFSPLHFKLGPKSSLIPQVPVSSGKIAARVAKEGQ